MLKTKINPKIIIYFFINISIIIILSLELSLNQTGFLIIITILTIFLFINKFTNIILLNNYLIIKDNYFFIKTVREKWLISDIEKINVAWIEPESGLRGNIFISIVIDFILGFFWSQPTCILNIYVKDKEEPYEMRVNAPKNSVRKLLKYLKSSHPQIKQNSI